MKTKKYISMLFLVCLLLSLISIPSYVSAASDMTVSANGNVKATAGKSVSVPVYLSENSGLMGYSFLISYDKDVLTPVNVEQGDILSDGNFDDNLEGSTFKPGLFKVIWNNSEELYDNGLLFTLNFTVADNAVSDTKIEINYDADDTYNENFDSVDIICSDVNISITNETLDSLPKFELSSENISAGDEFSLVLSVSNITSQQNIDVTIEYDFANFIYASGEKINNDVSVNRQTSNGSIVLTFNNLNSEISGNIYKLNFKCFDYATTGEYSFTCSCPKDKGFGLSSKVNVLSTESSDSAVIYSDKKIKTNSGDSQVIVPIYIKHNPGITGYKLAFSYSTDDLEIQTVKGTDPFAKNTNNSIGKKDGEFFCIWYNTEDVSADGKLLELTFNVLNDESKTSTINVTYSQSDTFNEAGKDVKLSCSPIDVNLNCSENSIEKLINNTFSPDDEDDNVERFELPSDIRYKGLKILGVQKKGDGTDSVRYVTVASSELLSNESVVDYGYVFTTSSLSTYSAKQKSNQLTIENGHKYSCKGTYNTMNGGYGSIDMNSTSYKYVTAAVNNINNGKSLVGRFYISTAEKTYYAEYVNSDGNTLDGCVIRWNEI